MGDFIAVYSGTQQLVPGQIRSGWTSSLGVDENPPCTMYMYVR